MYLKHPKPSPPLFLGQRAPHRKKKNPGPQPSLRHHLATSNKGWPNSGSHKKPPNKAPGLQGFYTQRRRIPTCTGGGPCAALRSAFSISGPRFGTFLGPVGVAWYG